MTASKVAALVLAGAVHLATLAFLATGLYLLVSRAGGVAGVVVGLLLIGLAWLARPRFAAPPRRVTPRAQCAALYALVDRIADRLGAKKPRGIAITADFGASFRQTGPTGTAYIELGLPLLSVLTPQERVALIAHELAHGVNGDPLRGVFVGGAVNTLVEVAIAIRPAAIWGQEDLSVVGLAAAVVMIPLNFVMLFISQCLIWLATGLLALLYRDSQRAEYLADAMAASVSGPEAMRSALRKLYLADSLDMTARRHVVTNSTDSVFQAMRDKAALVPEREMERQRRLHLRDEARIDATHPPLPLREQYMARQSQAESVLTITEEESAHLVRVLAGLEGAIQRELVDRHLEGLYQ